MVPTEDEKETLADLGLALHEVQVTEHFMRTILLFVLQKPRSGGLNAAAWDADSALLVRMTMGNLIVTLRSRVDLHPGFETTLTAFLKDRNTLAHNLNTVGDPHTEEGRKALRKFVVLLMGNLDVVAKVFGSLLLA